MEKIPEFEETPSKILGLTFVGWTIVFMIFSVVPLINLVTLPLALIAGTLVLASYILGRDYTQTRFRR